MPFGTVEHRTTSKQWAVVRATLGFAQMVGAVASLILLLQLGIVMPTLVTVAATSSLRVVSFALFRSSKRSGPAS